MLLFPFIHPCIHMHTQPLTFSNVSCLTHTHTTCRPLPAWEFKDYLGWSEQGDGKLAYGVFVQSGRLKGEVKKALRTVIERYELPVMISGNQNLILQDIDPSWKADILDTLHKAEIK